MESQPWYDDPDALTSSDNWAVLDIGYSVDHGALMGWKCFVAIRNLEELQVVRLGSVQPDRDPDSCYEYSFPFFASFALGLLKKCAIVSSEASLSEHG